MYLCVLLDRQLICSSFSLKATKVPLLQLWWLFKGEWQMPRHGTINLVLKSRLVMIQSSENCVLINVHKVHCFLVNKYNMIKSNIHAPPDRIVICHALQKQNKKVSTNNNTHWQNNFPSLTKLLTLKIQSARLFLYM